MRYSELGNNITEYLYCMSAIKQWQFLDTLLTSRLQVTMWPGPAHGQWSVSMSTMIIIWWQDLHMISHTDELDTFYKNSWQSMKIESGSNISFYLSKWHNELCHFLQGSDSIKANLGGLSRFNSWFKLQRFEHFLCV